MNENELRSRMKARLDDSLASVGMDHPIRRDYLIDGVENLLLQVYTQLPRLDESFVYHKPSSL
jgi:hypothetical protein